MPSVLEIVNFVFAKQTHEKKIYLMDNVYLDLNKDKNNFILTSKLFWKCVNILKKQKKNILITTHFKKTAKRLNCSTIYSIMKWHNLKNCKYKFNDMLKENIVIVVLHASYLHTKAMENLCNSPNYIIFVDFKKHTSYTKNIKFIKV